MNIQILPYLFKRIGLFLFFLSFIINPWTIGFAYGFMDLPCNCEDWQTPYWLNIIELVSLLGFILYFLSKEEVEDELIKQLRLEAMSMAFITSIGVLLIIHLMNYTAFSELNASTLFNIHLLSFLLLYHVKKMNFDL